MDKVQGPENMTSNNLKPLHKYCNHCYPPVILGSIIEKSVIPEVTISERTQRGFDDQLRMKDDITIETKLPPFYQFLTYSSLIVQRLMFNTRGVNVEISDHGINVGV